MRVAWVVIAGCGEAVDCEPATPATLDATYADFYVCLEDHLGCGPDGYAEGFGGRYVRVYLEEIRPGMSEAGAAWLTRVGVCLQASLADALDDDPTCDEVWDAGFATHAPCYLSTGYCDLPTADQLAVLATITEADRRLPEVEDAVAAVVAGCVR